MCYSVRMGKRTRRVRDGMIGLKASLERKEAAEKDVKEAKA